MNNGEIRSKVEAIDRVVREFAADIETFKLGVGEKMSELDSSMYRLSTAWEGDLHDNFESKIRERQAQIRSSLHRAGALKEKLDGIADEMAAMLEVLNLAGDEL